MLLLKLWMAMTATFVGGFLVWNYAPILIPIAVVTVALGLVTAGIVALARYAGRKRSGPERGG